MQNKCFNCMWFFSCKRTDKDPTKKNCIHFQETNIKEVVNDNSKN